MRGPSARDRLPNDSADIISTLRQNERNLRVRGVVHAALFGSVARGDHGASSDIDILIDIEPDHVRDIYSYVGLKIYIAELFSGPVDIVDRAALRPSLRGSPDREALYAF